MLLATLFMGNILSQYQPEKVLYFFEEISRIPRESGNERGIRDYIIAFAENRSLEYEADDFNNVLIRKKASKGYESSPTVILQGHTDMVCVKTASSSHDFTKDGIELQVEDGWITAKETSLGADNGIAVAYGLALLDDDSLKHPALEVLLTAEEETTMGGAEHFDVTLLKGRILINLDSEEEGYLLTSSAGGVEVNIHLPIEWKEAPVGYESYRIKIKGLKGGHSGADIDKGRANANKLMARLLEAIGQTMNLELVEINGGTKPNVIPSENMAIISIPEAEEENLMDLVKTYLYVFKNEFEVSDADIKITCKKLSTGSEEVICEEDAKKAIVLLNLLPNGIQTMSMHIQDLVESSCNLAMVETDGKEMVMTVSIRSSVKTLLDEIATRVDMTSEVLGAEAHFHDPYPAWQFNPDSQIRMMMGEIYKEKYGQEAKMIAIHAGLECGIFDEKIEGIDLISIGPDVENAHTTEERANIESIKNVWEFLIETLEQIK